MKTYSFLDGTIDFDENKKDLIEDQILSTEGGNRTRTMLPSLDFESSASTNSATSA